MAKHGLFVLGSAAAYPEQTYTQQEVLEAVARHNNFSQDALSFAERVFPLTQIQRANIPLPPERLGMKMDRATFRTYIKDNLRSLGSRACRDVLADWGGDVSGITHFIFGTMSSVVDAPGTECTLINDLKLNANVQRIAVQQMGCMTGFRCMNLAADIAAARPEARILVCVADVRSGLQNQLPGSAKGEHSRAALLSCALFRDAASAVIMGGRPTPLEQPKAEWLRGASHLIKGTLDQVSIHDTNDGIVWYNDKKLPETIGAEVGGVVSELFRGLCLTPQAVQTCCHPGGPTVLKGIAGHLGISAPDMQVSWDFLAEHGNTSGSSNLALLHNELSRPQEAPRQHILCLAFGPGVCIEAAVLRRLPEVPSPVVPSAAAPARQPASTAMRVLAQQLAAVRKAGKPPVHRRGGGLRTSMSTPIPECCA